MEKWKTPPAYPPRFPLSHRPRRRDTGFMNDKNLYATLLGLKTPWRVANVELRLKDLEVHVFVEHDEHRWECPVCESECALYDHQPERTWRHLDTMQYTTMLHAAPPRVKCPEHGIKAAKLPWAERSSRFTLLFERFAIDVLRMASVDAAAKLLKLSWDEAWRIKSRAVERGLNRKEKRPPTYVGIDEKSFRLGHSYMTVICDLETANVEWVAEDRTAESVLEYLDQFTDEQLARIEGFAVDMWRAYGKAIRMRFEDAESKIIYDRFHVMQEINKALDLVRKAEHRELRRAGDETLKGSKYLWLRSQENVSRSRRRAFKSLRELNLKTARAWAIKETLRHLWDFKTLTRAYIFWKKWYFWASHSKLPAVVKAAKKLRNHEHRILNYFTHRITNSLAEAINGQIERLKRIATGFRNKKNFKTAILFHHGGLDLYPDTH